MIIEEFIIGFILNRKWEISSMEKKISIIENVNGHTYDTVYDLVFTTERIIVVVIKHPLDTPVKFGATDIFIGKWATSKADKIEKLNIADDRRQQISKKSYDELISAHRYNFEIPYKNVKSVKLKKGLLRAHLEIRIDIENKDYKIPYSFAKKMVPEVITILEQVLSSKIV